MRRVADRLGVGTMSLYRYVPGKDELLDLMLDAVLAEAGDPDDQPRQWRRRLEAFARSAWRLYHEHPWVLLITQRHPLMGPNEARAFESLLGVLSSLGLNESEMVGVITLVDGYVRGVARYGVDAMEAERRTGITTMQWWMAQGEALGEVLNETDYPLMNQVGEAGVWNQGEDVGFEFGLERVLDGLDVLISARAGSPPGSDSWLEVDSSLEGAVHVEGCRGVLVGDPPGAVELAQAHGRAEPHGEAFRLTLRRRREPVQAVAEGDALADGHGQVGDLVADRPVEPGEPATQAVGVVHLRTRVPQRRRQVEPDAPGA